MTPGDSKDAAKNNVAFRQQTEGGSEPRNARNAIPVGPIGLCHTINASPIVRILAGARTDSKPIG
jgi:hypothetical protein